MEEKFLNLFMVLFQAFWHAVIAAFHAAGVKKQLLCSISY